MTPEKFERKARLIAYYLPQFHPIPENDDWWGKGFTEWTNVAKAKPLFRGHYQPRIPADLGFYDLRLPEARVAQAELAEKYGIEGFCYWHYWFGEGKRLLEKPFNEVLKTSEPKLPFCLAWANDSWTGIWHGSADKFLMKQNYPGKEDEANHFYSVMEAFADRRYITVEGKPLFYVYRPEELPDPLRFTEHWRELALREGLKGLYLVGENHRLEWNPLKDGFDACVPHKPGVVFHKLNNIYTSRIKRQLTVLYNHIFKKPNVYSYKAFIDAAKEELSREFDHFPSVIPNWDNTPRSSAKGYVLVDSTPELFREHLRDAIWQVADRSIEKRLIFIKSWNEWAEGNYLEPDMKFGRAYLEVCRDEVYRK